MQRSHRGHAKVTYWPQNVHLLAMQWSYSSHVMTINWPCNSHLLAMQWSHRGHAALVQWPCQGCAVPSQCPHVVRASATPGPLSGHSSDHTAPVPGDSAWQSRSSPDAREAAGMRSTPGQWQRAAAARHSNYTQKQGWGWQGNSRGLCCRCTGKQQRCSRTWGGKI